MMTKLVNGERVQLTAEQRAEMEAEWAANDLARSEAAARQAALAYREDRKRAYIELLGVEPDLIKTLGDVLDVVIKKVRAMESGKAQPEFDAMVAEIDRIKAKNPKPLS